MNGIVSSFLEHLSVDKGFSRNTSDAYRNDLGQFWTFLQEQSEANLSNRAEHLASPIGNFDWEKVDVEVINSYLESLKFSKRYRDSTTARKVASIKSFFDYLSENNIITDDPTESLASPKVARTLPIVLSEDEVTRLLNAAYNSRSNESLRDAVILELLYATGLRSGELVSLDVEHVNFSAANIRCIGKGAKGRVVYLHTKALDELSRYVRDSRISSLGSRSAEHALFVNHRGDRLTRQWVWNILKTYSQKAGINQNVTPHTLRHSFATHLLQRGASVGQVQKLLGHSSISTTQVYTHLIERQAQKEYLERHPRA